MLQCLHFSISQVGVPKECNTFNGTKGTGVFVVWLLKTLPSQVHCLSPACLGLFSGSIFYTSIFCVLDSHKGLSGPTFTHLPVASHPGILSSRP